MLSYQLNIFLFIIGLPPAGFCSSLVNQHLLALASGSKYHRGRWRTSLHGVHTGQTLLLFPLWHHPQLEEAWYETSKRRRSHEFCSSHFLSKLYSETWRTWCHMFANRNLSFLLHDHSSTSWLFCESWRTLPNPSSWLVEVWPASTFNACSGFVFFCA